MDIQTAYTLTGTNSKPQLAKFLGFESQSAVYQWKEGRVPPTSELEILKRTGLYPNIKAIVTLMSTGLYPDLDSAVVAVNQIKPGNQCSTSHVN